MSEMILYSYWRSSCSYRVRIALNLKNLEYDYRAIHLVRDGGEQYREDYLTLNPDGKVPCLAHLGKTLSESMAIIDYLDRLYPDPPLFPADPYERAIVIQMCETINASTQPLQNIRVLKEVDAKYNVGSQGKADWARFWIQRGLHAMEGTVAKHAGTYCFGDRITAADLLLVPQMYNAKRFKIDLDTLPTLKRIDELCLSHPAFQKAEPSAQPDAE